MEHPTIIIFIISCLFLAAAAAAPAAENEWVETICRGAKKPITKFHFYVHDIRTGPNATLFKVANASITDTSATGFGRVNVFDDRVTAAPDINSEEVARAQGLTTSADLQVTAFNMNLNFFITSGTFNGSTISILGRNQFADAQRELSVVGGAGAFRNARGYAVTSTYSYDVATNYSVLEYTIYVTSTARPSSSYCDLQST